jgi:hypothetical protein
MKSGHLYLIWEREFIKSGEKLFKIGRTDNIRRRLTQYPKGSRLLFSIYTPDCLTAERELIRKFKSTFDPRTDIGREYFGGESHTMIEIISEYVTNQLQNIIVIDEDIDSMDSAAQDIKQDLTVAVMEYVTSMTGSLSGKKIRSRVVYKQFIDWIQEKRYHVVVTHTKLTRELSRLYRTTESTFYFDDDDGVGIEHCIAFPYMLARAKEEHRPVMHESGSEPKTGRLEFEELLRRCRFKRP